MFACGGVYWRMSGSCARTRSSKSAVRSKYGDIVSAKSMVHHICPTFDPVSSPLHMFCPPERQFNGSSTLHISTFAATALLLPILLAPFVAVMRCAAPSYATSKLDSFQISITDFLPSVSPSFLFLPLGLVWGINRGHQTERRVLAPRPSNRKGREGERVKVIRSVIREVAGFAPYERRAMELIRNSKDKRARKFIKRRVGTLRRAKGKMESLTNVIAEQRRAGH